ncbi:1329_t:CDS:2 [Cetraspora pellucida]|uniref:1329_t:CDS:1 n=1 Tax=Cetraspora pellucida TaxID=1433469 RepID=A0A9N9DVX3_9GLOM|nr:1329_t:CDS:2 [Cetraspora pellucida]
MKEDLFTNLSENLHFAYENLNYNYYTHEAAAHNVDPQVDIDNQESVNIVSSNNQEIDISNQVTILYQTQKQEIFNLLDATKQIIEENMMNPNAICVCPAYERKLRESFLG